jgi:hypothetical protein
MPARADRCLAVEARVAVDRVDLAGRRRLVKAADRLAQRQRRCQLLVDVEPRIEDDLAGQPVRLDAQAGLDREALAIELPARLVEQRRIRPCQRRGAAEFVVAIDVDLGRREIAALDLGAAAQVPPRVIDGSANAAG